MTTPTSIDRYDYDKRTGRAQRRLRVPMNMPLKKFARVLANYTARYGAPELVWPVRDGVE